MYEWVVVGAGAAGIAAVGKLIDMGCTDICWIDPRFRGGDLGEKWTKVPSNTKVGLFLKFFSHCKSFQFEKRNTPFSIESLPSSETCVLGELGAPLRWMTERLREQVRSIEGWVESIAREDAGWKLEIGKKIIRSKRVVLAVGAEQKRLRLPIEELSLETVFDPDRLKRRVKSTDTVGVFGSSHSAILALAALDRLNVKRIYQFYLVPHRYAIYYDDWIRYDDTGLKGFAARWAKENLEGTFPLNLKQVLVSGEDYEASLSECTKVIYGIGFEGRSKVKQYDPRTGEIEEGLYGIGIAFPEEKENRMGEKEFRVGMWKFMDYLDRIVPIWVSKSPLYRYEDRNSHPRSEMSYF